MAWFTQYNRVKITHNLVIANKKCLQSYTNTYVHNIILASEINKFDFETEFVLDYFAIEMICRNNTF